MYKHFGKEVLLNVAEKIIGENRDLKVKIEVTPALLDLLYEKIYKEFILAIDAVDNGVD